MEQVRLLYKKSKMRTILIFMLMRQKKPLWNHKLMKSFHAMMVQATQSSIVDRSLSQSPCQNQQLSRHVNLQQQQSHPWFHNVAVFMILKSQ